MSREKREGTLGLLFLTPLTVVDVIAGKATIHILRALTLFLAGLPVLGLPLVLGGVEWRSALMSTMTLASAALTSIAAGLYASTRGGSTIQVMVLAEALAWAMAIARILWDRQVISILPLSFIGRHWLAVFLTPNFLLLLLTFALFRASARRLRATWHEEGAAPEQPRWIRIWTEVFSVSLFWQTVFRWNKSRTLDRNPIAWLQEYSWTARLTKWGWFALMLLAIFAFTDLGSSRASMWYYVLTGALTLGVAFSAAGSFRREQQTGLLELLLVTPLTVRQLLGGRLWGMCSHYLPALGGLWLGWTGLRLLSSRLQANDLMTAMFPNPFTLLSVMVVGLLLSLSRLNFFLAWLLTWVTAFVLPNLANIALVHFTGAGPGFAIGLALISQAVLAALIWLLLQRKVRNRKFLLPRTETSLLL